MQEKKILNEPTPHHLIDVKKIQDFYLRNQEKSFRPKWI